MKRYINFAVLSSFLLVTGCSKKQSTENQEPENTGELAENPDEAEVEDDAPPTAFTVSDLLQTATKATTRFERLAINDSKFIRVKTWKSEKYTWARLSYVIAEEPKEEHLFLACHFHGKELGCHKKDQTDPTEPTETSSNTELPDIDSAISL